MTDPIGTIGWTVRTGGVLSTRECLTLARPLLRGELGILAGRLAMALRMHSGRRSSIDPASLAAAVARAFTDSHDVPPDRREIVANAIAMHHTPGVGLESGAEAPGTCTASP